MTPTITPEPLQIIKLKLGRFVTLVKNFFTSFASIGRDDFEMYVLEKEMKPAHRQPHDCNHNSYCGSFSA
jgi:hypothetical protein